MNFIITERIYVHLILRFLKNVVGANRSSWPCQQGPHLTIYNIFMYIHLFYHFSNVNYKLNTS